MAPIRNAGPARRRSSVATLAAINSIKASRYTPPTLQAVTFAPNVTPFSFQEDGSLEEEDVNPPVATLFPPTEGPSKTNKPRKTVNGRRRSSTHVARPPNSFMLFRSNFIRQKHVPGSIETTHGSLSKVIGNIWKGLPLEEKRVWELRAKQAKAEHKAAHPDYVFRPVHSKGRKKLEKPKVSPQEERRCEEIAKLMLAGDKGEQLAKSIKERGLDTTRSSTNSPVSFTGYEPSWPVSLAAPSNFHVAHRRSSSLPPLPTPGFPQSAGPIAVPSLPPFYRSHSPVGTIASGSRHVLGHRRASSVQLPQAESWLAPSFTPTYEERDESPLPDMDTSLFNPSFSFGAAAESQPFSFAPATFTYSPSTIAPHDLPASAPALMVDTQSFLQPPLFDGSQPGYGGTTSYPSTAYSGSPSSSDSQLPVFAPQPQHAAPTWDGFTYPSAPASAPASAPVSQFDNFAVCGPSDINALAPMPFGQQPYYSAPDDLTPPAHEFPMVYNGADMQPYQSQFIDYVHDL